MTQDFSANPKAVGLAPQVCPQCGASVSSRFCGECGRPMAADPATADLRAVVREGAAEVLGLDRRLGATGRDLLLHPARVVAAHLTGRANAYVHPVKLFLFLGGLYMVCLAWLQPFSFRTVADDPTSLTRLIFGAESSVELRRVFTDHGLTEELADTRFQERANAVTPLVTALGLVPMAMILGLLQRDRARRDHFTFLLVISNAIWWVSLLVLPIFLLSPPAALVGLYVGRYLYLAIGFVAVYGSQRRTRTAARFAAFAAADVVVTSLVSVLLSAAILASVIYP